MFLRDGDHVVLVLDEVECDILAQFAETIVALVEPPEEHVVDPLAAIVGISPATRRPDDPALARLLPDAFLDDAPAAADFRRYTELDLRHRKVADAQVAVATLAADEVVVLDEAQARHWLGFLNDLRLVLGSRLGVTEEPVELDPDDPRGPMFAVYAWASTLQETLVAALVPRHP